MRSASAWRGWTFKYFPLFLSVGTGLTACPCMCIPLQHTPYMFVGMCEFFALAGPCQHLSLLATHAHLFDIMVAYEYFITLNTQQIFKSKDSVGENHGNISLWRLQGPRRYHLRSLVSSLLHSLLPDLVKEVYRIWAIKDTYIYRNKCIYVYIYIRVHFIAVLVIFLSARTCEQSPRSWMACYLLLERF